jgi:hypothetical protein
MAIFVTFEDKLGYTSSIAPVIPCVDGILSCEIKALEDRYHRDCWHPKCNLMNEVQWLKSHLRDREM